MRIMINTRILGLSLRGLGRLISLTSGYQAVNVDSIDFSLSFLQLSSLSAFLKTRLVMILLIITLLLSAFSTIYVKDVNRRLTSELQTLKNTQVNLHNEWSQLLLEDSAWANQARIAELAQKKMGMNLPSPKLVMLVQE